MIRIKITPKVKIMNLKKTLLLSVLLAAGSAAAQSITDDPNNAVFSVSQEPRGSVGAFIEAVPLPNTGGTFVNAENDGGGNLLTTDITNDDAYIIGTDGVAQSGPFSLLPESEGSIGATFLNGNIYVTDTLGGQVDIYNASYTYQSSFATTPDSTFPEGITTAPFSGNLYVVDGDGGDIVIEYDASGTLIDTYPINGSSPDGIAFDNLRCVFWIYDSGTDSVRSYDSTFTQIDTFPGTGASGQGNGEGLGVIGNTLYVVASGSNQLVSFDITGATRAANADQLCIPDLPESQPVPALNAMGLLLLSLMMLGVAFMVRARMV